jgi:hypothetical protein
MAKTKDANNDMLNVTTAATKHPTEAKKHKKITSFVISIVLIKECQQKY